MGSVERPETNYSRKKSILVFILAILLMMLVSIVSYYLFRKIGSQDALARTLVALIAYPLLGLVVWLGGFNLVGLDTPGKRLIGMLVCAAFFSRPLVSLGLLLAGVSPRLAETGGEVTALALVILTFIGVSKWATKGVA